MWTNVNMLGHTTAGWFVRHYRWSLDILGWPDILGSSSSLVSRVSEMLCRAVVWRLIKMGNGSCFFKKRQVGPFLRAWTPSWFSLLAVLDEITSRARERHLWAWFALPVSLDKSQIVQSAVVARLIRLRRQFRTHLKKRLINCDRCKTNCSCPTNSHSKFNMLYLLLHAKLSWNR
jgi:hypothetical protein